MTRAAVLLVLLAAACSRPAANSPPAAAVPAPVPPPTPALPEPAAELAPLPRPVPLLTPEPVPDLPPLRLKAGERPPREPGGPTPRLVLPVRLPARVVGDRRFLSAGSGRGAVALSPDGKRLALGGTVFDAATGALDADYDLGGNSVLGLAFSPDGTRLFANEGPGSNVPTHEGTLAVRDVAGRQQSFAVRVSAWGLSGDGRLLVTSESIDYTPPNPVGFLGHVRPVVRLYDPHTGAGVAGYRVAGVRPTAVAVGPGGRHIAVGCDDGAVRVWDRTAGREVAHFRELCGTPFPTHKPIVHQLAVSPDGTLLAAANARPHDGASSREVAWWRLPAGPLVHCRPAGGDPTDLRFAPDGRTLSVGTPNGAVVFDVATGKTVGARPGRDAQHLAVAPDGRSAVAAGGTRPRRLGYPSLDLMPWPDPPLGNDRPPPPVAVAGPAPRRGFDAVPLPDGGSVAVVPVGDDRRLGYEHRDAAGRLVRHYDAGLTGPFAVSADGRRLATLASTRAVNPGWQGNIWDVPLRVWDLQTGREVRTLWAFPEVHQIVGFALSPAGDRLLVSHADGRLRVWDVATGSARVVLDPGGWWCERFAFSADGRQAVGWPQAAPVLLVWDAAPP